jgi:phenylpropionate dioxygenase-like ring-hydroxylating dioxygenase large terminal subunit
MGMPGREQLAMMVRPDRVHRALYSDPALFELEMRRLFGRAWLLLGHESQIPAPGNFFTSRMGREPVIVARHADGSIRVLLNRCSHRGTTVCEEPAGHCAEFVCPYHGWTYRTDGSLRFVPLARGYGPDVEKKKGELGLVNVPRVESYRGFLFASLAADGPALSDFLGPMSSSFDDMVDRAPDGKVEVAGGVFKHAYNGNWKLVLENHLDGLHPNYVHASSVEAAREAPDPGQPEKYAGIATRQMRQNGAPEDVWESIGIWATDFGHGYLGDYHSDSRLVAGMDNPAFAEYRARLEQKLGKERAAKVLSVTRWNSIIYPNCSFMGQFRQLRIVHPLAVDRTVVYTYSFRMKGAPEEMYRDTIAFANVVNGTASWVLTDDLEVYERVQKGLGTQASDWVYVGRGLGGDADEGDGRMRRGATGTSELHIRSQFAAWLRYMTTE